MGCTAIRNGYLHVGSGKRKKKRAVKKRPTRKKKRRAVKRRSTYCKKRQKNGFGALFGIDAQIGLQVIGGLIDKMFLNFSFPEQLKLEKSRKKIFFINGFNL